MTKSKWMIMASAITLGAIAIFGTKPAKKTNTPTKLYSPTYLTIFSNGVLFHLTKTSTSHTAFFSTVNGSTSTILTASTGAKVYYF